LRRLSMMTVILCLLPLPSDTQWWSIANLHDPRVTRTSRSSNGPQFCSLLFSYC